MWESKVYEINPIGVVRSVLKERGEAPAFGDEGAPDAWLEINGDVADGLQGIETGDEIIVVTWLHLSRRDKLKVHPRGDTSRPLTGVFATRSPVRPNPIGLHRVTVLEIEGTKLRVAPLEAIDGTPVIDLKSSVGEQGEA
ncbi:MAG: tRNA (N6-threonylcarbamoyladenosine(37)-N6)-methyltransferase TrmO [Verrucomicrobiota bacterium]|jgi:tRNA-Thr(GGU) m(6)t(6)A37 methyltransferase TsaA|nr:tRNA (N6-threonylcarbamoyladenosine(37)-N6)-methyltransferase TrmO [Chthoniobacterales bacterium]MDQ3116852.1 tRNA (N6-threonylcarbamoyladenosine(37)-N6)-methyltransferase TrmO [Verrucomicrobiota bacterium]